VKPTLFISDLHLSPARPALVDAFRAFCSGPARAAAGVYVLGDLFDSWIGDDQLREPVASAVANAIRDVANAGTPVAVMVGNRDFLLGERFARAAGATLLPEQIVVDVAGTPTLLLHGDELCTGDAAYLRYRAFVREPWRQRRFLALPYPLRRAVGHLLRGKSRRAVAVKPERIWTSTDPRSKRRFAPQGSPASSTATHTGRRDTISSSMAALASAGCSRTGTSTEATSPSRPAGGGPTT